MLPRLLLAALLTLLLVAPVARGATFCVDTACDGQAKPTLDIALGAAATSPGKDTIVLGKGPFTGTYAITSNNPVDVIGPENDSARIVAKTGTALVIANGDSTVRNVSVQVKAVDGAIGIDVVAAGAELTRVSVNGAPGVQQQTGIMVRRGAQLDTVWATFYTPGSAAIVAAGQPELPLQLRNLSLHAETAIKVDGWSKPVWISHAALSATLTGVLVRDVGALVAEELSVFGGGTGVHAVDSTGTLRHATVAARQEGATALRAAGSRLTVRDSVLIGADLGSDVATDAPLELRYSAFRPERTVGPVEQPGADNVDLSRSYLGLPSFEAGVFAPAAGSALIDSGTPGAEAGIDLQNRSRPLDGDQDGVKRRDIGALEAAVGTSVQPAKVVLIDPTPKVVPTPTATPTATPEVTPVATPQVTPTPTPIASPKPTVSLASLKARTLRGRSTGTVKRVQVTLKRGGTCVSGRGTLRKAKTCSWLAVQGTGSWRLSFKRALPRGRYLVRMRALDAKGHVLAGASKRVRRG
ncbi:hypothetical protein C8N24_1448 [Solirubrobacter pauli]|uniref:Uncharacterized protein n=1 Tax=Solirubrobacter pauli TaxID=166793 RepID=A0A660LBM8_9ACTN|nr:hypothetical protein [Solirubrobacter pauli]RKQ91625.1 hypothetical protein C8N24_1448 [Solirubrobacter pauli]